MKGIKLLSAGFLMLVSMTTMADSVTSMDTNWICTTNASSSSVDVDKAADDKMAKVAASAGESFQFAASNCRDCTKITCEAKSK